MLKKIRGLQPYIVQFGGKDVVAKGFRWIALLLVLILSFFDPFTEGMLFPFPLVFLAAVLYVFLTQILSRLFGWLRRPLSLLVLDALAVLVAIYLTGGFHSSFFIALYFAIAGAAFYLNWAQTVSVALVLHVLYVMLCLLNPASHQHPFAIYSIVAKSVLLPLVAVLCALLLGQLRREREATERERMLASRLTVLNELFHQLSVGLDLQHVLQTVAVASCRVLEADVALVSLIEDQGGYLRLAAAHGIGGVSPAERRWLLDGEPDAGAVGSGRPRIFHPPFSLVEQRHPPLTVLQREGVVCAISVPLLLSGRPIGYLDVGDREACHHSEQDLGFLSTLGQEVAIAVRNARLYEAERRQVADLEALERLQSSFVSTVSHELRTPLTILKTSLALYREQGETCPAEMRQELLETIEHHTERLDALVTDLLEVTRLEARQVTLSQQPTDLRVLVERTLRAFAPLIDDRQQTVTVDMPPHISQASIDRRRVEQVLDNLLSNAHKFAPKGGHIQVRVRERAENLEVSVQDDGPGIPPSEQERIFERFHTLEVTRGASSMGLGLYIARQLVDLHGGRIWVESQPGAGSTFRFTLPKEDGQ